MPVRLDRDDGAVTRWQTGGWRKKGVGVVELRQKPRICWCIKPVINRELQPVRVEGTLKKSVK